MRSVRRKSRRQGTLRPELVKRIVILGLLALVLSAAMSSFFAQLTALPAVPDLMLGAVIAVALLDGRSSAAIFAVAGGITVDALGGVGASLSPLLYLGVVLTVGLLGEKMLPSFLSFFLLLLPSLVLRALFSLVGVWLFVGKITFAGIFSGVLLPEAISTLLLCLPIYFLVMLCLIPLKDRRERGTRL